MRKWIVLLTVLLLFASRRTVSAGMPIPPDIKKTVCFIYVVKEGKEVPNGTGFFVSTQKPGGSLMHSYLVTAKHVLQSSPEKGTFYPVCFIRLTQKGGGVKKISIALHSEGKNKNVFCHADPTVDIAVVPVLPKPELFEFKIIPISYLTSEDDFASLNVREGSDIFFVGMFTPHLGQHQNYPIIRFGRVALLSEEKVLFMGKKRDLYLIETFSFGGNSGSPVFVYLGADRQPGSLIIGSPVLKLAGVMSGAFFKGSLLTEVPTATTEVSLDNVGIAAVTPSYHLQEIILSEELKKARGY